MKSLLLLMLLTLTGCATTHTIEVPVPMECPKPHLPPEHHYPAQDLKAGDSAAKVDKAMLATIVGQRDYIEILKKGYE